MSDRAVQEVAIEKITCRKQVRESFDEDELAGLAQSIKEHGVLQPLLAHREGSAFILDDGERRLRAAKRAGLASVPVIVDPHELSGAAILQRQLVTNCQRQDLKAIETATAIESLMKVTRWTQGEVALRLGFSPGKVSRLLALLELPEAIQEQVAAGDLGATAAYQIARAGDAATQERLADEAVQKSRSRRAGSGEAKGARKLASGNGGPSRVTAALGGGRTVTLAGTGLVSLDDLVVWLEELLAKARRVRKGQPKGVELSTFAAMLRDEAKAATGAKATGGEAC